MNGNKEFTAGETQTINVLNETLEKIKGIENDIANPPLTGGYVPQLTPDGGFKLTRMPGPDEPTRVAGLEAQLYDAKAGALNTIQKNNAELPEAEKQQLYKDSIGVLYSDQRSIDLASDQNASQQRSPALAQEREMALLAKDYRQQINTSNPEAPSPAIQASFPEIFGQKEVHPSLEDLDISELEFRQNAHEITGDKTNALEIDAAIENRMIEGPSIEDMVSSRLDDMYALNAGDITEPDIEPTEPGDD